MQEIAFEIDAQRVGRASGYIGGLTIERYTFTGATIPAGTRLAILTRAGVTIASAEITEGNAAEVDTNTQEVADLLRYQPLGACESVYIALGNADDIIALIPAVMRKNWLDDEATHPPVPANRYPTKTELDQWLARFDERAAAAEAAKADAQAAAAQAEQRATAAETAKTAAGNSATDAANSAKDAGDSAVHAKDAQAAAEAAQGKSETAQRAAETAATAAGESAKVAAASEQTALSAKQSAETAQAQAEASETASKASETAAKGAETAARASEQAAKASEQAADESATAAAGSASAAKASETAAANSATAAEAAKTDAETAKNGAESAKAAAASSATAAANSATAAAKSATDLADAVATAESLDGRIDALEAGTGAYIIQSRDVIPHDKPTPADVGKVLYFDHFANETTSTLAVTNSTPWAQKVCPAPIVANGAGISVIGCFDYTKNKKYIIFASGISINKISYLYELIVGEYSSTLAFKSKLHTSYFSGGYGGGSPAEYCKAYCAHDGHIFYTRRHYDIGPYLAVCDVETGKAVAELDLDPKDTGGIYVVSAIWYNPLSGHICVLCYAFSLPTGETWGSNNASSHFIRVFSWDSETKTLADIPNGDSPVTIIDVTDALTEAGVTLGINVGTYGSTWPIRDQVFVSIIGPSYTALFHATADDRIEPCYEWDVEYATGDDGITRPVWETQPEEWTDANGNTQTIQNYVLNNLYDHVIRPKMTKGRLLKFCCAAGYDGVPSGTWSANPVFYHPTYSFCKSGENQMLPEPHWYNGGYNSIIALTDGVVQWAPIAGYKFVRREAFNDWKHLIVDNRSPQYKVSFFRRNEETGVYLLNDIRKGSARKFSGWLPKSGQYMSSVGATQTAQSFGNLAVLTPLTSAQSGTPLSRIGMVSNAGTDSAAMTPLPITATYNKDWWIASMLPYCAWGFFGNVWMTSYSKTIGGVL